MCISIDTLYLLYTILLLLYFIESVMLDLKLLRTHPEKVQKALATKGYTRNTDERIRIDQKMREIQQHIESYNKERNILTDHIQQAKQDNEPMKPLIEKVQTIKKNLSVLQDEYKDIYAKWRKHTLDLPNIPLDQVPVGKTEQDNSILDTR